MEQRPQEAEASCARSETVTRPTPPPGASTSIVARLFDALGPLSKAEQALLGALNTKHEHRTGAEIADDSEVSLTSRFLVSGWACRQRILLNGRRQILSFLVPGDFMGGRPRRSPRSHTSFMALTEAETIDAGPLTRAADSPAYPAIGLAFDVLAALEKLYLFDHIVRLGRQTAYQRMAHLVLELRHRLARVGLAEDRGFAMPLSQETLADALGLSVVHVNRVLRHLKDDGLMELRRGWVALMKPAALAAACDYTPPTFIES
jgi:CRP-like cAMP-binding protein